jgi:Mg-chelatase subunit ChlD
MNMILDQPVWMFVSLAGLLAGVIGWRVLRGLPTNRRVMIVSARFASFACIALALAGLQHVTNSDRMTVIAVVDVSGSIQGYADLGNDDDGFPIRVPSASLGFLSKGALEHLDDDQLGIIAFNGAPSMVASPRSVGLLNDVSFEIPAVDGTDIASALRRAQTLIPADSKGRIVLISDGVSTASGLDQLAMHTPVDVVPIEYRVENEVVVESVEIPARVKPESLMPVRVTLRSTGPSNGSLRIIVDGTTINLDPDTPSGGLPLALKGGIEPISLTVPVGSGRVHRVRAVWEPQRDERGEPLTDRNMLNNESSALTLTSEHGRALVVSSSSDIEARPLIQSLEAARWSIEPMTPAEVPADLLGLEPYDLVVLINTPRDALKQGIESTLDDYVRTLGGGLVFVGGYEALGAGGWNASIDDTSGIGSSDGSMIADLLPLDLEIPDDVVTTHAAVVLVLDSSGSMKRPVLGSSRSQQAVANNSAASAIEVLDPTDMIGVVAFSGSPRLVVPITKNDDPVVTQEKINSISSGGGTNLAPALRMARDQLLSVESKTKHIVVLSDGESQDPERLPLIAKELGQAGIKVSTITIGDEADEQSMRLIATDSGGVYYRVVNPAVLPRIFLKAVRVLRRPMIREGLISPAIVERTSPMLIDSGSNTIPQISGLVLTQFKTDDPRVMVPIVSQQGEPILAGHQVELGRVAVFTSDVSNWAGEWSGTDSFDRFWRHLATWTARAADPGVGELSIDQSSGGLSIGYSAIDDNGVPIDGLNIQAKVFTEGASAQVIDMIQIGPGQYESRLDSVPSGDHVIVATPKRQGKPIRPTIGAVHIDDQREFDALRSDRATLESIAQRSGGRVLAIDQAADLYSREGIAEVSSYESMWWGMLVAGFVLFLMDLGARRVAWDRWVAQARDETIAATRAVRADQLEALSRRTKQPEPSVKIDLEPVRRQYNPRPTTPSVTASDEKEVEELSALMAAKKRARERMDES